MSFFKALKELGEDLTDIGKDLGRDINNIARDTAVGRAIENTVLIPLDNVVTSTTDAIEAPLESFLHTITTSDGRCVAPIGSMVTVKLSIGTVHSGIHIGNGLIIQKNSDGWIEEVDTEGFISQYPTGGSDILVQLPQRLTEQNRERMLRARNRALDALGAKEDYNILFDNCHKFCAWCYNLNVDRNYLSSPDIWSGTNINVVTSWESLK